MNMQAYAPNWDEISRYIRYVRAGNCCEGSPGVYPNCRAENGKPHPVKDTSPFAADQLCWDWTTAKEDSQVVLSVSHLDHKPWNNDPANLRAMCQRCHLAYDKKHHFATYRYGLIAAGQRCWDWAPDVEPFTYGWELGQADGDLFWKWVPVQVGGARDGSRV